MVCVLAPFVVGVIDPTCWLVPFLSHVVLWGLGGDCWFAVCTFFKPLGLIRTLWRVIFEGGGRPDVGAELHVDELHVDLHFGGRF